MNRLIANLITLVRVPVIVLLVLPAFSLGWESPELMFWLYIIGLLSHGLDGTAAYWLKVESPHSGLWHDADTVALSLGLQLAAAVALFNELGTAWGIAAIVIGSYVNVTGLIEKKYVKPRKDQVRPYFPIVLIGSAFVWLGLGGMLAYQAYGTWESLVFTVVGLVVYGVCHAYLLHGEIWADWLEEFDPA